MCSSCVNQDEPSSTTKDNLSVHIQNLDTDTDNNCVELKKSSKIERDFLQISKSNTISINHDANKINHQILKDFSSARIYNDLAFKDPNLLSPNLHISAKNVMEQATATEIMDTPKIKILKKENIESFFLSKNPKRFLDKSNKVNKYSSSSSSDNESSKVKRFFKINFLLNFI